MKGVHKDPLAGIGAALERGDIVIVFPEGSRGDQDHLGEFKRGVSHMARLPQGGLLSGVLARPGRGPATR